MVESNTPSCLDEFPPLEDKYERIFALAQPIAVQGRDLDDQHCYFTAQIMKELLKEFPQLDEEVMMAAATLHDIGYGLIPAKERPKHYAPEIVKRHMEEGAAKAGEILAQIGYPKDKIQKVVAIIAVHDNPTLGLPISTPEGKLLKEADNLWMTCEETFWLDVARRRDEGMDELGWLAVLEERFTKDPNYLPYLSSEFSRLRTQAFLNKMRDKIKK